MACPSPFVLANDFPPSGGGIESRFCLSLPVEGVPTCCLPCPLQRWVYPDHFTTYMHASTYLNLAGVICALFLLLSFAILPVEYTHKHYLSVCLTIAILVMQTSFVIPLGNPESQCIDLITPHDMYSSLNCALSGSFLLGGGWCVAMWIFLRTLSLHLQICWQVIPGRRFFLTSQAVGWSVPVVFLAVCLSVTGVSFRFGESCHINSKHSLATFWGPLLGVTSASIVLQTITFCYCIKVYIKSLLDDKQATTVDSGLPYTNSIRTVSPAQAFRRIQRVIALQWRGIMVVIIIIVDVIFFATVFLQFEQSTEKSLENLVKAAPWVNCLLKSGGDKSQCLELAEAVAVPERTALAVVFLLSCNGFWALLLLGRFQIVKGWYHLFKSWVVRDKENDEFVSYNARRLSEPDPGYEMLDAKRQRQDIRPPPESVLPTSKFHSQASRHSSWVSSNPGSPEPDTIRTPYFSPFAPHRGAEGTEDIEFVHALSPKPAYSPNLKI